MSTATLPDDPQIRERFSELKPALTTQAAVIEANRCLNCFDAPCTAACPTHIDVPRFIKHIASGNLRGSALRILDANILGASCSRVCPVDVLCEGACVLHRQNHKPIQIARLQRHAMDAYYASGETPPVAAPGTRNLRVACIGGGPASLACAAELRRAGARHCDRTSQIARRPEHLRRGGIQAARRRTALREVDMIRKLGVEFRCGVDVDFAAALEALEKEFDFIFLGMGLGAMQRLGIPGEDVKGVMTRWSFIAAYKTGRPARAAGTVVVVARATPPSTPPTRRAGWARGTFTCSTGAASATCRRSTSSMSTPSRRACSFTGGVSRWPSGLTAHGRLLLDTARSVQQVDQKLLPLPDSQHTFVCDMVIPAIGQSRLALLLQAMRGVEVDNGMNCGGSRSPGRRGIRRYFAGGDCVNGGREVVDAVADGKRAAIAISEECWRRTMAESRARGFAGASAAPIRSGWPRRRPPTRRAGHARLRRRLGRRGVEDHRRADPERLLALFVGRLERPAHDGPQQHRADHATGPSRRTCARSPR